MNDATLIQRYHYITGKAKDLGIEISTGHNGFCMRIKENQIGVCDSIEELIGFINGFDWGQALKRP